MQVIVTTPVAADRQRVWAVMADVVRWPEWTESVDRVDRLDDGPLRVGSRVRIRQPRFPAAVWTVTELDEGRSFTWEARTPGLVSTASHAIAERGRDGVEVELRIDQRGVLAPLVRLLAGSTTRRYVQMEADGLRARCASNEPAPGCPPY